MGEALRAGLVVRIRCPGFRVFQINCSIQAELFVLHSYLHSGGQRWFQRENLRRWHSTLGLSEGRKGFPSRKITGAHFYLGLLPLFCIILEGDRPAFIIFLFGFPSFKFVGISPGPVAMVTNGDLLSIHPLFILRLRWLAFLCSFRSVRSAFAPPPLPQNWRGGQFSLFEFEEKEVRIFKQCRGVGYRARCAPFSLRINLDPRRDFSNEKIFNLSRGEGGCCFRLCWITPIEWSPGRPQATLFPFQIDGLLLEIRIRKKNNLLRLLLILDGINFTSQMGFVTYLLLRIRQVNIILGYTVYIYIYIR